MKHTNEYYIDRIRKELIKLMGYSPSSDYLIINVSLEKELKRLKGGKK